MTETTLFAFVEDFLDEGPDAFRRIADLSVDSVAAAFAYHSARDVLPHAGSRRIRFMESGALRFRPDVSLYPDLRGVPFDTGISEALDPLEMVRDGLTDIGKQLQAWVVLGHSTGVGTLNPSLTVENAHGDRLITSLCPANPTARSYFKALVADLGGRGIARILCESLDFPTADHGYHHERWFIPLSETTRFLLACCFCQHCMAEAHRQDVDATQVRQSVRDFIDQAVGDDDPLLTIPLTPQVIVEACGAEAMRYVLSRQASVTGAVAEVAATAARVGARLAYIDLTGARLIGDTRGASHADECWRFGINPSEVASLVDDYLALGYRLEPASLSAQLNAYRSHLDDGARLGCVVRPGPPDVSGAEQLEALLTAVSDSGCSSLGLYAYGFMRLRDLDRLRHALENFG